ncbi:NLP/P60 protein [Thermomonospora curvata DSM 43183]|uniref:NLP/P60 protein n=2 Tax=Thermomonospora curvata TaxID=2020 RepID=D1AEZ8_THECD|nr:NLP/P60 protein [Thermomonospora curvata DSM 43183]
MSIPLKALCGAATVALALVPSVGQARVSGHAAVPRPDKTARGHTGHVAAQQPQHGRPEGKQGAPAGLSLRHDLYVRQNAAVMREQALQTALRRRTVRYRRAKLIEQWQRRADRAVRFALKQRGKPYQWGATGPHSYDCSGLVQQAWRRAGVSIPRVSQAQYHGIRTKVPRDRLRPGDLVLFNGLRHVGMYIGRGRFIHAPRTGRTITVERLRGYYARSYVGAVRPAWPRLPKVPKH